MKVFLSVLTTLIIAMSSTFAIAGNDNRVPYLDRVTVSVGDRIVVHGLRGECGQYPKKSEISAMEMRFSDIKVGKIVAGKKGIRKSRSCGGNTPVVEAVFVAQKKGRVKIKLFGDSISIRVK